MKLPRFMGDHERLRYVCLVLTVLVSILAISIVALGFFNYSLSKQKRTVIIPSHLAAEIEVSDFEATPSYIRQMAIYSISLIYQYTPNNAQVRFQEFLVNFVPSSRVDVIRVQLQDRLERINKLKVSESLHIDKVSFSAQKDTLLMEGFLNRYASGRQIGTEKTYLQLEYKIVHGGFKIETIKNINAKAYSTLLRAVNESDRNSRDSAKKRNDRIRLSEPDTFDKVTSKLNAEDDEIFGEGLRTDTNEYIQHGEFSEQ